MNFDAVDERQPLLMLVIQDSQIRMNPILYTTVILKAFFWPKDLPRCFRFNCSLLALPMTPLCMAEERLRAHDKSETFREILRPKEGLRMTDTKECF